MATLELTDINQGGKLIQIKKLLRELKLPWIPITILTILVICSAFAPLLAPHDPTDLNIKEIDDFKNTNQNINKLKVLLANETTTMLHGSKEAKDSEITAQKTFGDKSIGKNLPTIKIRRNIIANGINILDLVLQTKLGGSKSEVRRMIKNNGLKINNEIVSDDTKTIYQNNFDKDSSLKVSHGKKQHVIVKII